MVVGTRSAAMPAINIWKTATAIIRFKSRAALGITWEAVLTRAGKLVLVTSSAVREHNLAETMDDGWHLLASEYSADVVYDIASGQMELLCLDT